MSWVKVATGLSEAEARRLLEIHGPNIISRQGRRRDLLQILAENFSEPIVLIFIAAAIISAFLGEILDFAVISAIVVFIVLLSTFQEYKAEEAIEKLKEYLKPSVKVLRDGRIREISVADVVPGDILLLSEGDRVPADCKVLEATYLLVDESLLTGESRPVEKTAGDMLYAGTSIVRGLCKAEVIATGSKTRLGKIAGLISEESKSSLEKKMEKLADQITKFVVVMAFLAFLLGIVGGEGIVTAVSIAISTAIAGIPEALPLTTTVILALSMYEMAKKRAIVRKMRAVEELGLITVICSDKTGTITKNEMELAGIFEDSWLKPGDAPKEALEFFLVCSEEFFEEGREVRDPTEKAVFRAAEQLGISIAALRQKYRLLSFTPFNPKEKVMKAKVLAGEEEILIVKGAPERVLEYLDKGAREIEEKLSREAAKGRRVVALAAIGKTQRFFAYSLEDPPREGVKEAIKLAKDAGIRVIMLTGDAKETAEAIARTVGIEGKTYTGSLPEAEEAVKKIVQEYSIFARVAPEDKLKIVKALRDLGEIVAVTGDGVNDAPALMEADVGIAMGRRGSEVAKEVADIVLADDNFATIVEAIKYGRGIYENIRRFTAFLLSWNIGITLTVVLSAILFAKEPIFLPLQILLLNVILEDLPAVALGLEPITEEVMRRPPRDPKEDVLPPALWLYLIILGLLLVVLSFIGFMGFKELKMARTVAFTVFAFAVLFNMFNFKRLRGLKDLFSNKLLIAAGITSVAIAMLAIYSPAGKHIFGFYPLPASELLRALGIAFAVLPSGFLVRKVIKPL